MPYHLLKRTVQGSAHLSYPNKTLRTFAPMTEIPRIVSKETALVVMDMQPMIFARFPTPPQHIVAPMVGAIQTAREKGITVAHVRVALTEKEFQRIPQTNKTFGRMTGVGSAAKCGVEASQPSTQIMEEVRPRTGDIVVRKSRAGAFSTTDLKEQLQSKGINTLLLAGISTSGVVLSTVRDASDADFRIFVLRDCTADGDDEVHRILLDKVFAHSCYVVDSTQIAENVTL